MYSTCSSLNHGVVIKLQYLYPSHPACPHWPGGHCGDPSPCSAHTAGHHGVVIKYNAGRWVSADHRIDARDEGFQWFTSSVAVGYRWSFSFTQGQLGRGTTPPWWHRLSYSAVSVFPVTVSLSVCISQSLCFYQYMIQDAPVEAGIFIHSVISLIWSIK